MIVDCDNKTGYIAEAKIIANTDEMSHEEWLSERRKGIGGSDVGAIMGLSKYGTPLMTYLDKKGILPPKEETGPMRHGKLLEPFLRDQFARIWKEESGKDADVLRDPNLYESIEFPLMRANIDGLVVVEKEEAGLEIKTGNIFTAKEWKDDQVPDAYYAQVQHYMTVLGLPMFYVLGLIGADIIIRVVPRDTAFITDMVAIEKDFWENYVLKEVMPSPSGMDDEDKGLSALYGKMWNEQFINAPDLSEDVERYLILNSQLKEYEAEKKILQQKFKIRIQEAKGALVGGHKITWSRFQQKRVDADLLKKEAPEVYERVAKSIDTGRLSVA